MVCSSILMFKINMKEMIIKIKCFILKVFRSNSTFNSMGNSNLKYYRFNNNSKV
jgi:hypothetical protein